MNKASKILDSLDYRPNIDETDDAKFKSWRSSEVKNGADIFYYKKIGNDTEVWSMIKNRDKLLSTYNLKTNEVQRYDNLDEASSLNVSKLDSNKFYALDYKKYMVSGPYNSESEAKKDLESNKVDFKNCLIDKGDAITFILSKKSNESLISVEEGYVSKIIVGITTYDKFGLGLADKYMNLGGECSMNSREDKVTIRMKAISQRAEDKILSEFDKDNIKLQGS